MAGFGGSNEIVVFDVQTRPDLLEIFRQPIDILSDRHTLFSGGRRNFCRVFVCAGQEKCILTLESMIARSNIGHDRRIGVTDMRHIVDVVDRCRYVVCFIAHSISQ